MFIPFNARVKTTRPLECIPYRALNMKILSYRLAPSGGGTIGYAEIFEVTPGPLLQQRVETVLRS